MIIVTLASILVTSFLLILAISMFPFVVGSGGVLGVSNTASFSSSIAGYLVSLMQYANGLADVFPPFELFMQVMRYGIYLELLILGVRLTRMLFNFVRGSGA